MIMVRDAVDFFVVEDKHLIIHKRLENWARWNYSSGGSSTQPMFRLYVSDEHWEGPAVSIPVDILCASDMQKGVSALPIKHRQSLNWNYLRPGSPRREAQRLGESLEGLVHLIRNARQMLINRGYEKYRLQVGKNRANVAQL